MLEMVHGPAFAHSMVISSALGRKSPANQICGFTGKISKDEAEFSEVKRIHTYKLYIK